MPPETQVFLCKVIGMCVGLSSNPKSGLNPTKLAYILGPTIVR